MDHRKCPTTSDLDEFLTAILDDYDPEGAADFAAALLGEQDSTSAAEFAAEILGREHPAVAAAFAAELLCERNFNPDEPRDERGRWTTGGSAAASSPTTTRDGAKERIGTRENGYNGLGTWGDFKTQWEFLDFLQELLKTDENKYPAGWENTAIRGCIGLNLLRIGWSDRDRPPRVPFLYPDAEYYADRAAAEARFRQLQETQPGRQWLFVAAQMPLRVQARGLVQKFGQAKADISEVIRNASVANPSDYNFATWFPGTADSGYWEYMNHASVTFDPAHPPCVYHKNDLPETLPGTPAEKVITLYGVVSRRLWKK